MARLVSQGPVFFKGIGSTVTDVPGSRAGIVDSINTEIGVAVLSGIEAGTGIQLDVVDADDDRFTDPGKKIIITNTGINSSSVTGGENLGTGEGVFSTLDTGLLQFKSLVAGSNITITSTSSEITINSTATGGSYQPLDGDLTVKSLLSG